MHRFWRGTTSFFGGVLGTGLGIALGFFFFPYVFPPPPAAESLTEADRAKLAATGTFIHANPSDSCTGAGARSASTNAPCFWSRISRSGRAGVSCPAGAEGAGAQLGRRQDLMYVDLGGLRAFKGSQRYPIPAGVDLKSYPSVVIWCERFSVLISPADLRPQPLGNLSWMLRTGSRSLPLGMGCMRTPEQNGSQSRTFH